jgi:integrase/recombinase XerD
LRRLLYAAGVCVSELTGLRWRDCQERDDAGQITVLGKRDKTRSILLTAGTWRALVSLRRGAGHDSAVFTLRRTETHLDVSAIGRVVRCAARPAGINLGVSPYWLRRARA